MLVNLTDFIKRESNLTNQFQGTVVDNLDPLSNGRIKCEIMGLFEGSKEVLPWIYPHNSSLFGGNKNQGIFVVPDIGSKLIIEFPFDDIYAGFYTGFWQNDLTTPDDLKGSYPSTYGFVDSSGNKFLINKEEGTIVITHKEGSEISFDSSGDISISSPANINIDGAENINITADTNVVVTGSAQIHLNGQAGQVLTNITDPVVDYITGAPSIGLPNVRAGG